jgi:hypothetical protein
LCPKELIRRYLESRPPLFRENDRVQDGFEKLPNGSGSRLGTVPHPVPKTMLSGCTKFPESRSFVFNLFPGFNCIIAALKSRIIAGKSRTN